jgi:hypothetical protein
VRVSLPITAPAYILLTALSVIVALIVVVALVACAVVAKARPEDLPQILPGLGRVLEALALFLPWGKRTRSRAQGSRLGRRGGERR